MATTTVTNQNYTPASTAGPTLPKQPTGGPLVVSTSKAADDHIAGLGNNITTQLNGMNQQAANKQQTVSQFANDALTQQANRSGMTPQQMGAQAEQQMKDRVIQQSQANPGQLQTGAQMGSLQTGTEQTPITFQAMTQNNPQAQPTGATQSPTSTQQPGSTTSATPTSTQSPSSTSGISASRQNAVQGLLDQGITDPNQMLNYLNFDEKGNKIGDFTADEVNNLLGSAKQTPEGQLAALNRQSDQAYNDYTSKIQSIQNGTFPLNPLQQSTINSIMQQFQGLVTAQKAANKNYTSAIGQANITSGRARYAPSIAAGEVQRSINAGIAKIAEIESKASAALVEAQTAFQKEDYAMATTAYETLQKHLDAKTETLTKMMDTASKAASEARKQEFEMYKFGVEQEQKGIENTLKFAEFDAKRSQEAFENGMASKKFDYTAKQDMIKNMMESDKFDWQQKKDMLQQQLDNNKFALEGAKFTYQQEKDIKDRLFDIEKLERADTPSSYREWELSGKPGTYAQFLDRNKIGKQPTQDQTASAGYAQDIKAANNTINDASEKLFGGFMNKSRVWNWATFKEQQMKPKALQSPEFQQFTQAGEMLINAINRKQSGAAVSESEWQRAFERYLPQGGDSAEVQAQKKAVRDTQLQNFMNAAGPALSTDFKDSAFKKTYATLDDYAKDNPDKLDLIDQVGQEHPNWSDDDVMQAIQSLDQPDQKTKPLSMGENGSSLGGLSAKYESSGNPGAIGYDSTGGNSYGTYQLAHNNAKKFVEQSPYAAEFKGIPFNSEAFKQKWREVAKQDPESFKEAQHDYIAQTHYEPQKQKLASLGVDLDAYSPVLKDVIFSTGVQHGGNNNIIESAFKKLGKDADEEDLIKEIYKERWAGGKRFASSTPAVRQSVYKRFFGKGGEMNTAINQLKQSYA